MLRMFRLTSIMSQVTTRRSFPLVNSFHTLPPSLISRHKMPPRPKLPEDELEEVFLKGGRGPGGQKINKTNSKVQLKHIPTGVVVTCQATRSQSQNRKKAREILGMKVQHLLDPENSRQTALLERKSQQNSTKKKRGSKKYQEIEEQRQLAKEQQEREELEILMMAGGIDIGTQAETNSKEDEPETLELKETIKE